MEGEHVSLPLEGLRDGELFNCAMRDMSFGVEAESVGVSICRPRGDVVRDPVAGLGESRIFRFGDLNRAGMEDADSFEVSWGPEPSGESGRWGEAVGEGGSMIFLVS